MNFCPFECSLERSCLRIGHEKGFRPLATPPRFPLTVGTEFHFGTSPGASMRRGPSRAPLGERALCELGLEVGRLIRDLGRKSQAQTGLQLAAHKPTDLSIERCESLGFGGGSGETADKLDQTSSRGSAGRLGPSTRERGESRKEQSAQMLKHSAAVAAAAARASRGPRNSMVCFN